MMGVTQLSKRVRHDLTYLSYPPRPWTVPRAREAVPVLDVLIVGGGHSGLGTAFGLKLERITNVRIIDRCPRGLEGPWRRFARMREIRTPKEVTGIDFGIPSLTARAWYEAKFGHDAWQRIDRIPQEVWRSYLDWYRDVLELAVENDVELMSIEPDGDLLLAHLRHSGRIERVHARKIVLATGFDGSGRWRAPPSLVANLPAERYARTADEIDFSKLADKRVGVLGAGASAFDNAAVALEAGASRVDLCFRRADIPRVNPLIWMNFAGLLGHFAELTDLERWRFMRRILEELPVPPTQDTFWRCRSFANFAWHANCHWKSIRETSGGAEVETESGTMTFDFIIFGTGVETDLAVRPELAPIVQHIALWHDRFTPPPGEDSDLLANHPYLGSAFEFTERELGTAPYLNRLHNFTFGAMPSLGLTGAAIPGTKYGLRRLVNGLARDLFVEDSATYYQDLLGYQEPELASLESAVTWLDRFFSDTINPPNLIDQLNRSGSSKGSHGRRAPRRTGDLPDTVKTILPKRARAKRTILGKSSAKTNKRAKTSAARPRAMNQSTE
ncbi:MAG TPA: NAD(P)/FAD-dependent oxidoreductase [Bradyrhizobium sp.]|nr:NAD(P)/FAD-dependent oxidoreductase [Bradyrhizobium sp.]